MEIRSSVPKTLSCKRFFPSFIVQMKENIYLCRKRNVEMALNLNDCKEKLKEFRNTYGVLMGINRIGIFGSVARGENTDSSDIDIVVDVVHPSFRTMTEMRTLLQSLFGQDVDLVRYRQSLRPRFKQNIDKEAVYV